MVDDKKACRQFYCWGIGRTSAHSIDTLSPSSVQTSHLRYLCAQLLMLLASYHIALMSSEGFDVQEVNHRPASVD